MMDEGKPMVGKTTPGSETRSALIAVGKKQVDAFFKRQDAHMIDDSEFLPLLEVMLISFENTLDETGVDELWSYAFQTYDRLCKDAEPESSFEENQALMQSYLLGSRGEG